MSVHNSELILVCLCGCCFVEARDYGFWGMGFAVYTLGKSRGERAMRTGAINTVLEYCCEGAGK